MTEEEKDWLNQDSPQGIRLRKALRTIAALRALVEEMRKRSVTNAIYGHVPHRSCLTCGRHWPVGDQPEHTRECALALTEGEMLKRLELSE